MKKFMVVHCMVVSGGHDGGVYYYNRGTYPTLEKAEARASRINGAIASINAYESLDNFYCSGRTGEQEGAFVVTIASNGRRYTKPKKPWLPQHKPDLNEEKELTASQYERLERLANPGLNDPQVYGFN